MNEVTIVEVPAPASPDDPNAWAAALDARLWAEESLARHGHLDLAQTETSAVAVAVPHASGRRRYWAAVLGGEPVGVAMLRMTLDDNLSTGSVSVIVRPDVRRRGIGTALLTAVHDAARDEGRSTLQGWDDGLPGAEPGAPGAVESKSRTGWVDVTGASGRFPLKHGYLVEQLEVHSLLDVPVAPERLDDWVAQALPHASDYDLVWWADGCPQEYLDDVATLLTGMFDAPSADLDYEPELWDADRVRAIDVRWAATGTRRLTTAARHRDSGRLVAFTVLAHQPERAEAATQDETLVLQPHRGHRLGMLIKAHNLRLVAEHWPGVRRVHTWNADENDHMLAINRAIGFRAVSVEVAWQRRAPLTLE